MPTLNDTFKGKNFGFQFWTLQQRAESAISTSMWHDDRPPLSIQQHPPLLCAISDG